MRDYSFVQTTEGLLPPPFHLPTYLLRHILWKFAVMLSYRFRGRLSRK